MIRGIRDQLSLRPADRLRKHKEAPAVRLRRRDVRRVATSANGPNRPWRRAEAAEEHVESTLRVIRTRQGGRENANYW